MEVRCIVFLEGQISRDPKYFTIFNSPHTVLFCFKTLKIAKQWRVLGSGKQTLQMCFCVKSGKSSTDIMQVWVNHSCSLRFLRSQFPADFRAKDIPVRIKYCVSLFDGTLCPESVKIQDSRARLIEILRKTKLFCKQPYTSLTINPFIFRVLYTAKRVKKLYPD